MDYTPISSMATSTIIIVILISIWSLIWKGFALWKAAQKKQKAWFIAILILNTVGILPIIYIFFLAKTDVSEG